MLSQLTIENVALIDKLELELKSGLNILSGETGAGKSIIIDSLNFVLGERADKTLIRYGCDFSVVQAAFEDYQTPAVRNYLYEIGVETEDTLIVRRKMAVDGKNECRINGRLSTLSVLKGLTELLVDIHGQHEHQSLLKPENHIGLLDSIADKALCAEKNSVFRLHAEYDSLKKEIERFGDEQERIRKLDILNYQITEIEKADVKDGEEEELLDKRRRVHNLEKILNALEGAKNALDGYDVNSVTNSIKNASTLLSSVASFEDGADDLSERLNAAKSEIADISGTISDMLESLDFDSRTAESIEERLDEVRSVLRKYGGSYEAAAGFLNEAKDEAYLLENAGGTVEKLNKEIVSKRVDLIAAAEKLTKLRNAAAQKFEKDMLRELADLGMAGSTFKVEITSTADADKISSNGADKVEFLISPNAGEPLKPLAKIISGGEMSRFMLALKNIIAGADEIGTMVFDEIDTGISGNISAVVSEKMCNISRNRQVVAVTHMPSLAAMADNHYLISKSSSNGKTLTGVALLEDDTAEIARLIGGDGYSVHALPHAKEMKAWAQRYKQTFTK